MRRFAGTLFGVGGVGFFLAGLLHPHGLPGQEYHGAVVSMLMNPLWPAAHWLALVSALVVAWSLSLLAGETSSPTAIAGIQLGIPATLFMAVEFAVELTARTEMARFEAGETSSLIALVDTMQTVGWPALALAFTLIAAGTALTPRWVIAIGIIGAASLGLGGLIVQGLHVVTLAPLFVLGNGLPIWMVWAGIRLARGASFSHVRT